MRFFYDASTRAKLLTSFILIILINAVILGISISSMNTSRNASLTIDDILANAFTRITNVQIALQKLSSTTISGLNELDSEYTLQQYASELPGLISDVENAISVIRPDYFGADSDYAKESRELIDLARKGIAMLNSDIRPHLSKGYSTELMNHYLKDINPYFNRASALSLELLSEQAERSILITRPAADPTPVYVNIVLALIGTITAVFLAMFISGYIARCIAEQSAIIQKLAGGDFSFHISDGYKDEFGQSHNMLRDMRNRLNEIIATTKHECLTLQKEMRHLQQVSQTIVDASGTVETQAVSISAASDEMVSTTADIARNCESAAASSQVCRDISDNGMHQVINAVNMIRAQSEKTKANAQKIESLAQQTNNIGSIVSTIDDIAAQTNLLALNAAIEAARAGEAGRGFAVVADEVRALASRTTASTQEISKMVKNIQDEAAAATEQINQSVSDMDEVAEKASNTETLLQDITSHVVTVNGQITQIATAAEEQTTATSEISQNMQHITSSATDVAHNANTQSEAMDNAYNELERLLQSLAYFKTRDIGR